MKKVSKMSECERFECERFSVTFDLRHIVYMYPKFLQGPVTGILYFNHFWVPIKAFSVVVVVVLLFYVHGKHLRSCRDGQLT